MPPIKETLRWNANHHDSALLMDAARKHELRQNFSVVGEQQQVKRKKNQCLILRQHGHYKKLLIMGAIIIFAPRLGDDAMMFGSCSIMVRWYYIQGDVTFVELPDFELEESSGSCSIWFTSGCPALPNLKFD